MGFNFIDRYKIILGYDDIPYWLDKYLLCPSLVRLKKICYFCGMDYASSEIYDFKARITRYDHSLFVALLVWKLTKDKKSTLAGLFHDISTPCFSHVIDYMNNDYEKQESTEEKTEDIIKGDKYLLNCLEEDEIDVDTIIDFKIYSIVDLDRPMLCADRLDGIILTGYCWTKNISFDEVVMIIQDLIVINNEDGKKEIGFKSSDVARLILDNSILIDKYCHSNEDNFMMELLANITKRLLELNIISYEELFVLNEEELFNIIEECDDKEIVDNLDLFKNIRLDEIKETKLVNLKIRDLNPYVLNSGRLI